MADIRLRVFWALALMGSFTSAAQVATAKSALRSVDVVVADVLKAGNVPGGIEVIAACNELEARAFDVEAARTDNALTILSQEEPRVSWVKRGSTYTVTIKTAASPSVAAAKLPALQLRVKTLSEATDILLQQKALRSHLAELKMSEASSELGFSSIHEREAKIISLPAGTLREDLNALAAAFGTAIWRLDQHDCEGNRAFRLSWIVK
jgi:hypothetical protein